MRFWLIAIFLGTSIIVGAQEKNSLKDSLKRATDELEYHPDSIELRLRKASWNMELQQWNAAKTEYDFVLKREPGNLAALYYRAFANEKLKRYNFARLDYQNLLAVDPGNFEGQLGMALLNQKDMRYTEALNQINRLVDQYPDSAIAYAARAGIEKERNMKELAAYDYAEAVKHDSTNLNYRVNLIDLLITLNRKAEARDELDNIVKLKLAQRAALIDFYRRLKNK